jgi:hypothetical protein
MTKINFNGHQVGDVLEGVYAVINHYVNPVIGMLRLDEEDGRPFNEDRLRKAYMNAATDIVEALGKHVTERLTEERERIARNIETAGPLYFDEHGAPCIDPGVAARIAREGA